MRKSRILFVFTILTLVVSHVHAQTALLHGTVLDKDERVIDYANVLLLSRDSAFIKGTMVDQQGQYSISIEPGKYLVQVKAMGFKAILQPVEISSGGLEQTFRLSMSDFSLKEIVVTSKTPLVKREADKLIFDANQVAPASHDALDILKNVPGVVVTNDDIKILGQQGVKVLINGKEQKLGIQEFLILLKSYQAEQVDKIEVMTTPPSRFDAEGSAGLINIKLKKNKIDYMSTTLNYGYQYDKYHTNTANINFIYNRNRLNFSLNGYGAFGKSRYKETNQEEYEMYNRQSTSHSISKNNNYNFRGNIDYQLTPNTTIGALGTYSRNKNNTNLDGTSKFYSKTEQQIDSILLSKNPGHVTTDNYRLGTYLDATLDTLGRKVHFDVDYLRSTYDAEKTFSSTTHNPLTNHTSGNYGFNNDNDRSINAVTSALDFILPFKHYTVNLGAKLSLAKTKNKINYYNQPALEDQNDLFYFTENVYSLYAELSKTFSPKLSFKSGLRLEHTYTKGKNRDTAHNHSPLKETSDTYTRLFPVLYLGYNPHEDHQFNLSLSSRISRPSFRNINPFVLYTNKYSTVSGKPDLKPAYTYKVNLGYTLQGNFNLDLFYSYSTDDFTQVQKADVAHKTLHTFWDNVLDSHIIGINNSYFFDKIDWMQLFLIHGITYETSKSKSLYTIPTRKSLSYIAMMNTSFFFNQAKTFTGWMNASYSSPQNLATTDTKATYNLDLGAQYALLDRKLKIALSLNSILSSHVRGNVNSPDFKMSFDNTYSYPTLNLSITYILGAKLSGKRYSNTEIQERM
uniref:Outer membrane beta-barrel family protein n=1 Tax=Prevotella sp. GTC17260 TaxID=3236796 RepID=A0AB33JHV9_9BACT